MLLRYEYKKLFGLLAVKVCLIIAIGLTGIIAFSFKGELSDASKDVFIASEGPATIENYIAVLTKAEISDPFFWHIEVENSELFDRNYIIKKDAYGYKEGEKIDYQSSPIYEISYEELKSKGYSVDEIRSAFESLFANYKDIFYWDNIRESIVLNARNYYEWFKSDNKINAHAKANLRKANLYSSIKAPDKFIIRTYWRDLLEGFINNKGSIFFIIIASAFLFGLDNIYKTRNLVLVTQKRDKLFMVKLLGILLLSIVSVLAELAIILSIHIPGGHFHSITQTRIQNIFLECPFNVSILSFLLIVIAAKIIVNVIVALIAASMVSSLNSVPGGALATGFIVFTPLLIYYIDYSSGSGIFEPIYINSIIMLLKSNTWIKYNPRPMFNIPTMLHEYLIGLWACIGLICSLLSAFQLNKRFK